MLGFLKSRRRRVALAFTLAVMGTLAVHPTWARSIGADVWNMPALKKEIRATVEEKSRLDAEDEDLLRRIQVKETIIADLIAQRITLAEATARFTVLNASRPQYMEVIRATIPGDTDHERMARTVIGFVPIRVAAQERDRVLKRLETELQLMKTGSAGQ